METKPLRVSLLGLGRAGSFHRTNLRHHPSAVLAQVYDTDRARAEQVAREQGCRVAESAEEATASDQIDCVVVATPTDTHYPYVQAALAADKPVLTEKPLGRHLAEIDTCFALAQERRQPLFVAFQRRFDPSFAALVARVRQGELGQLQFVRSVSRDNPLPSLAYLAISGGIFHDCIVHDLDMLCHLVGETPERVACFAHAFRPEIAALNDFDTVAATLIFPGGVTATIDISRHSVYGYDQRLEAFGSGGMLQAENRLTDTVVAATVAGHTRGPAEFSFPTRYREAYQRELDCFLHCARGDEPVPITHADVRMNHLLANALELAAREKRVVTLTELL